MTRDECACVCSHCVHVCVFTSLHYGESISNHSSHTGHRFLSILFFLKIFSVHQYHLGRLLGGWIRDCLSRLIPQVLLTLMMLLLTAWIFSLCWFFFKGRHVWRPSSPYFLNLRLKMVKNAYPPSHHHDNPDHSDHLQHGESGGWIRDGLPLVLFSASFRSWQLCLWRNIEPSKQFVFLF